MEVENAKTCAVQFIRDLIVSGELEAGQKLVEKKLASILGISAIPLREAFRVLESEYLVLNIPRKGVYVTELSIEDLQKAFQAREMIECYVIKILMEKNIIELPEVASVVNSTLPPFIPVHKSRMDKLQYYKTWANFHRKLLEASNNILLINLYSSISSLLHRYLCIYEYIPGDRKSGAQEHNEIVGDHNKILSLINKGSYDQAEAKMRSHIRKSLRRLKGQVLKRIGR